MPTRRTDERTDSRAAGRPGATSPARPRGVLEILGEIARTSPDRVALKGSDSTLAFAPLERRARRIADGLASRLGRVERPVAIVSDDPLRAVPSMLGVLAAGGPWVVVEPSAPPDVAVRLLRDAGPLLVLTDDERGVEFARACGATAVSPEEVAAEGVPTTRLARLAPLPLDATACLLYTSGSSGPPKGVMRSHEALVHAALTYGEQFGVGGADRMVLLASPSRGAGVSSLFRCLLNGAACHLFPLREAGFGALRSALGSGEVTLYHSVPTVFRQFLLGLDAHDRFPAVRLVHLGGEPVEPLDVELFRRHFGPRARLIGNLGATEAPTFLRCTIDAREGEVPAERLRYRSVSDAEVVLLDEGGREVREGEAGEIAVRSAQLSRGYWNRPDLTARAFRPGPNGEEDRIYRTRDRARRLPDGSFELLGRLDRQVKVRGQLVDLAQANKAFQGIVAARPELAAGVLTSSSLPRHGLRLVAYVEPAPGHAPRSDALRALCVESLPPATAPSAVVVVPTLPRRPDGSVDVGRLPAPSRSDRLTGRPPRRPRLGVERELTRIFRDLLALTEVGIDDCFFALGGDSILALRLLVEIENRFDVRLPSASLVRSSSPLRLAARIEEGGADDDLGMEGLHVDAPGAPLFAIGGIGGSVLTVLKIGHRLGPGQPFHALHPPGMDWERHGCRRLEEMAATYLERIRRVAPHGPYRLLGTSFGGLVAFEIARQVEAGGEEVELLAVVDSNAPGRPGGRLVPEADLPDAVAGRLERETREVLLAQKRASRAYRPAGPVRCPILYFRCDERRSGTDSRGGWRARARRVADRLRPPARDRRSGWDERTTGGIRVVPLPGRHGRFGRPPQLDVLVDTLRAALASRSERHGDRS
ncbi:MAG: AMP-binding protein [Planctomycetota bacterium JB042]